MALLIPPTSGDTPLRKEVVLACVVVITSNVELLFDLTLSRMVLIIAGLYEGPVLIDGTAVSGWEIYPMEMKKSWINK